MFPYNNIFSPVLYFVANFFNKTVLYISIDLTLLNSKIFVFVINKNSTILFSLYIDTTIIIHPIIIKDDTNFN